MKLNKDDTVFYVRIIKGSAEILTLKVRSIDDVHFVGVYNNGITYMLSTKDIEDVIFVDYSLALLKQSYINKK